MTDQPSSQDKANPWDRLRRRKVVQWGLAYSAAAWGVVQALAFGVDTFQWPGVLTRIAAVVAVTGLPVTVILAWFHGDRGAQRVTRTEWALLGVVLAIGGYAVVREFALSQEAASAAGTEHATSTHVVDRRRIAILPFDNLGNLPANAAFVGGVHDTLITQVAKVPGLSVISRSSVLQFAGGHPTIREVAAALGVGTVLEGSVAREGDRLRIQAQLIDASSDTHLWAETFDRRTDDLFAVQSDIAQAVAEQLRIRLTGDESRRLKTALTANSAAYEHYVLGRNFAGRRKWPEAIQEFATAVTLDPHFAAAYAFLSLSRTWLGYEDQPRKAQLLPLAKDAADRALALDPTLPEAHLAMAVYLYRGEPDIDRAAAEFERAIAGLPNDAEAHINFSYLRRWQGRWDEFNALAARAAELDPYGPAVIDHITALVVLGRREEAARAIDAALALRPLDVDLVTYPGFLVVNFSCDLAAAERVFDDAGRRLPIAPEVLSSRAWLSLTTGDAARALDLLDRIPGDADLSGTDAAWIRVLATRALGKRGESDALARQSIETTRREMTSVPQESWDSGNLSALAMRYGVLGDLRTVRQLAQRALRALPKDGDRANRAEAYYQMAIAFAWAGDPAGAVTQVRSLLSAPTWREPSFLWCDPYLAPLRSDPEFRRLLTERGTDTSIDPTRRATWPKH